MRLIDPVLQLLFGGMLLFTAILIGVSAWFGTGSPLFQVVSSVLTGLVGSFLTRLKPESDHKPGSESTVTTTVSVPAPPDVQ